MWLDQKLNLIAYLKAYRKHLFLISENNPPVAEKFSDQTYTSWHKWYRFFIFISPFISGLTPMIWMTWPSCHVKIWLEGCVAWTWSLGKIYLWAGAPKWAFQLKSMVTGMTCHTCTKFLEDDYTFLVFRKGLSHYFHR